MYPSPAVNLCRPITATSPAPDVRSAPGLMRRPLSFRDLNARGVMEIWGPGRAVGAAGIGGLGERWMRPGRRAVGKVVGFGCGIRGLGGLSVWAWLTVRR